MRIEQLQYVAAVTQYGSLRRASEHLHISQPALSESLTKLEKELGVTLLDRRRSGTRISATGRELLQHIVEVLDAAERLRAAAGDQSAAVRVMRIGTVNAGTSTLLLPAIQAFQQRFPGVSVEVRNLQHAEIHRDLLEGTLDIGIINLLGGDDVSPELAGIELLQGSPVAVLSCDHPLRREDRGHRRRPPGRAVRRDALGLPDVPVRPPPLRCRSCPPAGTAPTAPRWAR